MEHIYGGQIKNLKNCLMNYVDSPDEETNKIVLEQEISKIMEAVDSIKKALITQ